MDKLTKTGWNIGYKEKADKVIGIFRQFIEKNKDEIIALRIIYNQAYIQRQITLEMIEELYDKLNQSSYNLTHERLWEAYATKVPKKVKSVSTVRKLTYIVSLICFELGFETELVPYSDIINRNFKAWVFRKNAGKGQFTEEQMDWLRMIKEHMIISMYMTKVNFELSPFDKNGRLGKFYELFGVEYEVILAEINVALVA